MVTPFSLVCAALLTYPRKGVYRRELLQIIQVLYDYLRAQEGDPGRFPGEISPQAVEETLALCEARKLITPIEKEEGLTDELGLGGYSIDEPSAPCWNTTKTTSSISSCPLPWSPSAILARQGFEFDREQVLDGFRLPPGLFQE